MFGIDQTWGQGYSGGSKPSKLQNTRVTLTTLLGCLSCISVTKECYQIGFIETSLKSTSSVTLDNLFSICLHSGHFYHKPCNQGTQGRCVQHTSPDLCAFWKKTHEGSISTTLCSNCKHFLNFTCHAHKRIATEVVKYNHFTEALLKSFPPRPWTLQGTCGELIPISVLLPNYTDPPL